MPLEPIPLNDPHNWPEDFDKFDGFHHCECDVCDSPFIGHKRRTVCKLCDDKLMGRVP